MTEPLWMDSDQVLELHARQLAIFGGAAGVRDHGALEAALDRPRNKWAYEGVALPELGAAYAFGLARSHPFVDGNKRVAFLTMATFLIVNGASFRAPPDEATTVMLALAAGELDEDVLARWIATHAR